jgi:branched-chain amino acid transport system substrate-binding protein
MQKIKMIPVATALVAAFSFAGAAQAQEVIKIGHVAPLTGPNAHIGKDNENGARMAVDELNAKGFEIGGKKVTFQLVPQDDASDPKQATVAQALVDAKVKGGWPHELRYHHPGLQDLLRRRHPADLALGDQPQVHQQGFNTAFRVVANDGQLGGVLGRYAVNELKGKNVAVIDDRTAYGQGARIPQGWLPVPPSWPPSTPPTRLPTSTPS